MTTSTPVKGSGGKRLAIAGLTSRNIARESLAGITLAAIAIPLNIGYAQIAGLPATAGLYALIVPTLLYAVLASSRQVVVSPDAAAAALVASSIGGLAVAGSQGYAVLATAQAILCGVILLVMAVFRLGFLASFLSEPILLGFVGGLALDILLSQLGKMLGVPLASGEEFVGKLVSLFERLPDANVWSIAIAVLSLTCLLLGRRWAPIVPWALVVLVCATIVATFTHAADAGVAVLGEVPSGLPSFAWPRLSWQEWAALVPSALALTMVAMAEGLLLSRAYGEKRGYEVRPNRDLLAFGAANVAAGLTGSFAVGSSTSRTAAMDQAGSRTQFPSIVLAVVTLVLLLFGTALLANIPSPSIGAIVAVAVFPLLGIRGFRAVWRRDRFEFAVAAVCFLVTLLVGSIAGILVAFVLSLINVVKRASTAPIDQLGAPLDDVESSRLRAGASPVPGVVVIRLAAPLFFANADAFVRSVKLTVGNPGQGVPVRHLVIDMEAVTDVDVTAAEAFERLREWLRRRGVQVSFSRLRVGAQDRLKRLGVLEETDRVFDSNREALVELRE